MIELNVFIERIKQFGLGRLKLDNELFSTDEQPPRLGIYDVDTEELCHNVISTTCSVPGCKYTAESLLEFENHYNSCHRYTCCQCKKNMPSPHLLDLHIQENHDSFFAVTAEKKPSYCCYIEECKEKFLNADIRLEHCVTVHKLPKDFRFDTKPKLKKKHKKDKTELSMDLDELQIQKQIQLNNSKSKGFIKYQGKKFTNDKKGNTTIDMDECMSGLQESLPQS